MGDTPGPRASALAEHLRHQAHWRHEKFEQWGDDRSKRASDALLDLADYAETLAEGDPRLVKLAATESLFGFGEDGDRRVSRYGHDGPPADPDRFLTEVTGSAVRWVVEIWKEDAGKKLMKLYGIDELEYIPGWNRDEWDDESAVDDNLLPVGWRKLEERLGQNAPAKVSA